MFGRQIISTGEVTLEVQDVDRSIREVRAVVEAQGGFVEKLTSTGQGASARADLTPRVPTNRFFATLDGLDSLGEVRDRSIGSQDVTSQHIDLSARLRAQTLQENRLLALVEEVETVTDLLSMERELTRVRTEIELLQGQISSLDRRIDLATIGVRLQAPAAPAEADPGPAPSANLTVGVFDVSASADRVIALVEEAGGTVVNSRVSKLDDGSRADLTFRVDPTSYETVIASLESLGKLRTQELRQGTGAASRSGSQFQLSLDQRDVKDPVQLAIWSTVGFLLTLLVTGYLWFLIRQQNEARKATR